MAKRKTFFQRGSAEMYLLIGIIIIGAFFLVGGVNGGFKESEVDPNLRYAIDLKTTNPKNNTLQIDTLKFKPCTDNLTVNLLLDRSDSMKEPASSGVSKIDRLKEAVTTLTNSLTDTSIIGIQSFNSNNISSDVEIGPFKNRKEEILKKVNALTPNGYTPTNEALAFSYNILRTEAPKYPKRKFNFIFISDGVPVPDTQNPNLNTPNPATQIKSIPNVTVYSIGIRGPGDATSKQNFNQILGSIASTPGNYYEAPTGDELKEIIQKISNKICESEEENT